MYLNRVELIGFLGADAEVRDTSGGKTVTSLVATKASWKQDGERKERAEWHRVVAWGGLGEYAASFKKGAHLRVEGELRSREYDGKADRVQTYEIVADSLTRLRCRRDVQRATLALQPFPPARSLRCRSLPKHHERKLLSAIRATW